jgi:hypothetical protein
VAVFAEASEAQAGPTPLAAAEAARISVTPATKPTPLAAARAARISLATEEATPLAAAKATPLAAAAVAEAAEGAFQATEGIVKVAQVVLGVAPIGDRRRVQRSPRVRIDGGNVFGNNVDQTGPGCPSPTDRQHGR